MLASALKPIRLSNVDGLVILVILSTFTVGKSDVDILAVGDSDVDILPWSCSIVIEFVADINTYLSTVEL
jgi:hypothetical protein